jgi:uncharacterized protein (DUF302 family)
VVVLQSSGDYADTATRLTQAISRRGLTIFARIDHAAGARAAGLDLQPEEVLIFGNPKAGTPLMQVDPRAGYDLPLRMLLWQEGDRVLLGYENPEDLAGRYELARQMPLLEAMKSLLSQLALEAAS